MALKTVGNPKIAKMVRQVHEVDLPPLCPKTGNPIEGSKITIIYTPKDKMLEVYSLGEYINSFANSRKVRDVEELAQVIARDCQEALGVKVSVIGKYVLNIGQRVICECQS
jgi:7-cyano-7-deazaguanine reductase